MSQHVYPLNDLHPHITEGDGSNCPCEPRMEWLNPDTGLPWTSGIGPLVVHNSYDGRELYEEGGPFYEPDPDSSPQMLGLVLIVALIAWVLVLGSLFYIITR